MKTRTSPAGRGFALIELLVVLVIAGMLAAALPFVLQGGVARTRLETATAALAVHLREARSEAVRRHQEIPVAVEALVSAEVSVRFVPADGRAEEVRFFADGSATPGRLELAHGERTRTLRIEGLLGRIAEGP